MNQKLPGYSHI